MNALSRCLAMIGAVLAVHSPLAAQGCARNDLAAAARIVEFNALLMAASLRCRMIGVDIMADYDRMLVAHAKGFKAADEMLMTGFTGATPRETRLAYDRHKIGLSIVYGGGKSSKASCTQFARLSAELSESDLPDLHRVAGALVPRPRLPAGAGCPTAP